MQIIDIHMGMKSAVDDALARAVAIGGLVAIALLHVLQTPDAFAEVGYLGALFILAAAGCLLLAAVLTRTSHDLAWAAAGGLPALILLGFVVSRSVGLPGFTGDIGEWAEPPGLAAMVAESLLIVLTGAVLAGRHLPVSAIAARRTGARAWRPHRARPGSTGAD